MSEKPIEHCHECGNPTGKAGPADDSIYTPGGVGPFCEGCYDEWAEAELVRADEYRDRIAELESQLATLQSYKNRYDIWFDADNPLRTENRIAYYWGYCDAMNRKPAKNELAHSSNCYAYDNGYEGGTQDIKRCESAEAERDRLRDLGEKLVEADERPLESIAELCDRIDELKVIFRAIAAELKAQSDADHPNP